MKIKHILFDLDGTLTDPKPGITRSIQYAMEKLRIFPGQKNMGYTALASPMVMEQERSWLDQNLIIFPIPHMR